MLVLSINDGYTPNSIGAYCTARELLLDLLNVLVVHGIWSLPASQESMCGTGHVGKSFSFPLVPGGVGKCVAAVVPQSQVTLFCVFISARAIAMTTLKRQMIGPKAGGVLLE